MATTMGILALLTALGAIWFTSEILRRVRRPGDPSMDRHIRGLSAIISQNDRTLRTLNKRLKEVEAGVQGLKSGIQSAAVYRTSEYTRAPQDGPGDGDNQRFRPSLGQSTDGEKKRSAA
ncbi:MAG TPA: hypothetical protein ENI55_01975 [Alphaproteobacteria bacterium]|nr:hypothetical protein [Alphaproteobacteria bacterium]